MKLSVVIVNYNVQFFLEQCLKSVFSALQNLDAEVFVVDNHSVDGSVAMVRSKFPQVKLIANQDNPGFSRANNQAIKQAKGEYILLLNPDTVVEENTFKASLEFMDSHPNGGGLGIKMIDGKGHYLPESKRGLPTPWVAFYKIFGLTKLFPRSKKFARYYLGHLSPNQNHEVEILAGAYMMMRSSVLKDIGLLDEDFFMYGEDIDLSYRILKGGYKNYYLAESSIIHYKGESTKKGSLNYVFVFYKAMVIFAQKHFTSGYARLFALFLNLAIYLRAAVSILARLIKKLTAPLIDTGFLVAGLYYIKEYWEDNHRFISGGEYPAELMQIAVPLYISCWLAAVFFNGGYDRQPRAAHLFKGVLVGTVVILVGYSLVDEQFRFSRAIIVLGAFWAALILPLWRYLAQRVLGIPVFASAEQSKRLVIVGAGDELQRVKQLVLESGHEPGFTGYVSPGEYTDEEHLGKLENLPEICRVFEIDEVVFCSANMSGQDIMGEMSRLSTLKLEIKIAPPESQFIIGSNSINAQGAWYAMPFNAISKSSNKRAKRLLDICVGLIALIFSPLLLFVSKNPRKLFPNIFLTLLGQRTWVGYDTKGTTQKLPALKPAVIPATADVFHPRLDAKSISYLNQLYAKDYRLSTDLQLIVNNISLLGS